MAIKYFGYEFNTNLFKTNELHFKNSQARVNEFLKLVTYFENDKNSLLLTPKPHPLDQKKLQQWVNAHCVKEYKDLLQIISKLIKHVSFNEFMTAGKIAVDKFNKGFDGNNNYILILGLAKHVGGFDTSVFWVTVLLYRYLDPKFKLLDIVEDPDDYLTLIANEKANASNYRLLFMDDASYTGTQIRKFLFGPFVTDSVLNTRTDKIQTSLIFCYITTSALNTISTFNPKREILIRQYVNAVFYGSIMKTMKELLLENKEFQKLNISADDINNTPINGDIDKPWIFFDHKFPDYVSTARGVMSGRVSDKNDDYQMVVKLHWHEDPTCKTQEACIPFIPCDTETKCGKGEECIATIYSKATKQQEQQQQQHQQGGSVTNYYKKYTKYKNKYNFIKGT